MPGVPSFRICSHVICYNHFDVFKPVTLHLSKIGTNFPDDPIISWRSNIGAHYIVAMKITNLIFDFSKISVSFLCYLALNISVAFLNEIDLYWRKVSSSHTCSECWIRHVFLLPLTHTFYSDTLNQGLTLDIL